MNRSILAAALAATLVLAPAPFALGETHAHAHDSATSALALDHGRAWPTDAPLRQHMNDLRATMAQSLPGIEAGALRAADYAKLGAFVEGKVASIVTDCKLPPEADAMLHVIVADLVAGADAMKAQGDAAAGAHKVVTALNAYAQYFDHPGFKPLG